MILLHFEGIEVVHLFRHQWNRPAMESLVDCQLVKNAFSDILVNHCKPLQRYVKMTWIAMLSLSTMMLLIVLLWVSTTHHEQKRHFADGSEYLNLEGQIRG
uniref:Uncharacterized protein n=1 Tax=Opuntia streptacantha TaxID=393608 RepID=A0A7C9CJ91_OPUST